MIVDTAWSEGYSVVVLVPVPEDADEWHGTVTFSHPILSANVSDNASVMISRVYGWQLFALVYFRIYGTLKFVKS